MNPSRFLLISLLPLLVLACGEQEEDDNDLAGPCVDTYEEPVLIIEDVVDEASNDSIDEVEIWNIQHDGSTAQYSDQAELGMSEHPEDSERQICTPICGFGAAAGHWSFTVDADGYATKEASFDAEYEEFHGGCPSVYDGGTRVELSLTPEE